MRPSLAAALPIGCRDAGGASVEPEALVEPLWRASCAGATDEGFSAGPWRKLTTPCGSLPCRGEQESELDAAAARLYDRGVEIESQEHPAP